MIKSAATDKEYQWNKRKKKLSLIVNLEIDSEYEGNICMQILRTGLKPLGPVTHRVKVTIPSVNILLLYC